MVISRLNLVTQSSRKAKPRATPVLWNLTFHILLSPQYKYPLYPQMKESFQREFWERNPRVKQDWFTYNLYIRVSLNSSTLFLSIVKPLRGILPKPCSYHIHYCKRAVWCSGKQLGGNQFHIGWCYGQVAKSEKQKRNRFDATSLEQEAWKLRYIG